MEGSVEEDQLKHVGSGWIQAQIRFHILPDGINKFTHPTSIETPPELVLISIYHDRATCTLRSGYNQSRTRASVITFFFEGTRRNRFDQEHRLRSRKGALGMGTLPIHAREFSQTCCGRDERKDL